MSAPTRYSLTYDFTAFQVSNPNTPLPADKVEIEFNNLETTTDAIIDNLSIIQRSDGALQNGIVAFETLSTSLKALLGTSVVPRGAWVTATAYAVLDLIEESNSSYICAVAHTAGTFATDYAAGKWVVWSSSSSFGDMTLETVADTLDEVSINDVSEAGGTPNRITLNNLFKVINTFTAETAVDKNDVVGLYDVSAGNADKATVENIFKAINTFTAETAPAIDDELPLYDLSGTSADKITLANMFKVINALTDETAVDTADEFVIYDASAGTADKATLANVIKGIGSFTDTVIAASDIIPFLDASDSNNVKRDTVQGLLDLAISSGFVPIKTVTANNDATIDFVNGSGGVILDGTYKAYIILFNDVVPATDGASLVFRTSTNAGSSFDSTANDYAYHIVKGNEGSGTVTGVGSSTATYVLLADSCGNAATESISGEIYIANPAGTRHRPFKFHTCSFDQSTQISNLSGSGARKTSADIDAIRFLMSSGNITSGTFTLYGLKSAS